MKTTTLALIVSAWSGVAPLAAQSPDTVLVNGKIVTVDSQFSIRQAIAIRDGKIVAAGTHGRHQQAGRARRRASIDLQGRTVIPGLIDSHLHAIRAALSFSTEVNWIGAPSLDRRARADPRRRAHDEAGRLADCRRRLERAAVQGEPAADAGGAGGRRAGQSRSTCSSATAGRC